MRVDSFIENVGEYGTKRIAEIWDNLGKNNLWKRILKNVIATTTLVAIVLIPSSRDAIGRAAYLGAITTVFGHPGRRFGQMAEALILVVAGTILGVIWSTLGIYLGSLVIEEDPAAAYAIRGIFLALAAVFHGFLRSKTPRLFIFVLLLIICCVVTLVSPATSVTAVGATQILYPILIAVGVLLLVNLCIFPEFSSRFLGQMTIDTLKDTAKALEDAGSYFVMVESSTKGPGKSDGNKVHGDIEQGNDQERSNKPPVLAASPEKASNHVRLKHGLQQVFHYPKSSKPETKDMKPEAEAKDTEPEKVVFLSDLTNTKAAIRKKLSDCTAAQRECNFELALSVLPPRDMKPLSVRAMKKLVANTTAVISACESKFALLGDKSESKNHQYTDTTPSDINVQSGRHSKETTLKDPAIRKPTEEDSKRTAVSVIADRDKADLEAIKPKREIEFGDVGLLRYLLQRSAKPYGELQLVINRTVEVIIACVAFVYDVPKLPSGTLVPKGIVIEELDLHLESLQEALSKFDADAASTLEGAAIIQEMEGKEPDVMPREEVFLISSFILNVRQGASHMEDMLKHSRDLVERCQQRHGRRRFYAPHIKWSNWLYTGSQDPESLPSEGRKTNRKGESDEHADDKDGAQSLDSKKSLLSKKKTADLENTAECDAENLQPNPIPIVPRDSGEYEAVERKGPRSLRLRGHAADGLEWIQHSDDLLYAVKLAFAVFLVTWPAFLARWNTWYSLNRGLWAALQLILITEVSIGTSVMTFIVRAIGTTLGCLWGWASLEAHDSNRIVCAVMMCIAFFPCAYVQLGTQYPKAGMVGIISICVVALSVELQTIPGTATEAFLKRWIAFMIGGIVALVVEVVIFPVKARTRLVESIAAALHQINEMETCIAAGIEEGVKIDVYAPENFLRFERASGKANGALSAAETFLPFCSKEPRIKGSFEGLALIYGEMLFVLHQMVDRMENMLQLRTAYGSGPLEELNAEIYPYRRNVAGSVTLTLFAIHSALTNKLPLPQFLPSSRLAYLRMINRVREIVLQSTHQIEDPSKNPNKLARQRAMRRKYMAWNAASAAQIEIIEFLEELIDLTKLLVGANEFKSGLLSRPTYFDYAPKGEEEQRDEEEQNATEARDIFGQKPVDTSGLSRRRRGTTLSSKAEGEGGMRKRRGTTLSSKGEAEEVPASLRRIQSRKLEAGVRRQKTNERWEKEHNVS